MIRAQQGSIDDLKQILSQLLKEKKKPKTKTPSTSKGKWKEGRAHLLQILRTKSIPTLSYPNFHLQKRITQKMKAVIPRG